MWTLIICLHVGWACGFADRISYKTQAECETALAKIVITGDNKKETNIYYCKPQ